MSFKFWHEWETRYGTCHICLSVGRSCLAGRQSTDITVAQQFKPVVNFIVIPIVFLLLLDIFLAFARLDYPLPLPYYQPGLRRTRTGPKRFDYPLDRSHQGLHTWRHLALPPRNAKKYIFLI
jgi:hypothetical protein